MMPTNLLPTYSFAKDDPTSVAFQMFPLKIRKKKPPFRPHRHNFYELFFFVKGGGEHILDFEPIEILDRSIHFVAPGQVHLVQRDLDSHGYALLFSRDFFHFDLANKHFLKDLPFWEHTSMLQIDVEQLKEFQELFAAMQREYKRKSSIKKGVLRAYLQILLLKSQQMFAEQYPDLNTSSNHFSPAQTLLKKFENLVEQHFVTLHQVNEYAQLLAVTPNHLNNVVKKWKGKNASGIIYERLILEAKRLLLQGELSNKEIAFSLSFKDPAYFSRFFKKQTGMSPSAFKQQIYEKYQLWQ
ncbi:MAG: helix-turn-helix domain-containing protein [Chitinophagales bacterium]